MGADKKTQNTQTSSTTQYTPTPQEQQLETIQLGQAQAADPFMQQLQKAGLTTGTNLLQGQQLPGYLSGLPGGITNDAVNSSIQEGMRQLNPYFQQNGLLNSGVAADISSRFAGQQKLGQQQFNLQNLMQLLNIGVGGQATPQSPILATQGQLGSQLAGLRTGNSSSMGNGAQYGQNPFLNSFEKSSGSLFGNPFATINKPNGF